MSGEPLRTVALQAVKPLLGIVVLWASFTVPVTAGESIAPKSSTETRSPQTGVAGDTKVAPPPTSREPYDFKGIKLGIYVDELRRTQYPDMQYLEAKERKDIHVRCTVVTDDIAKREFALEPLPQEKEVGVSKCGFYGYVQDFKEIPDERWFQIGQYGAESNAFYFIRDPGDGVNKLYKILLFTTPRALGEVVDALQEKFGPPTSVKDDTVQNRMGATFPQKTYFWSNATSSIMVQSPSGELDNMTILYSLTDLQEHVNKLIEAKKHSIKNRM
jgi:hypothetical protein